MPAINSTTVVRWAVRCVLQPKHHAALSGLWSTHAVCHVRCGVTIAADCSAPTSTGWQASCCAIAYVKFTSRFCMILLHVLHCRCWFASVCSGMTAVKHFVLQLLNTSPLCAIHHHTLCHCSVVPPGRVVLRCICRIMLCQLPLARAMLLLAIP
jgi:hypothetical protein